MIKKTIFSWTGGYIGLHAIVPISYLLLGSVVSGMVGLTLNIFIALQNLATSFLVAKVPLVTHFMSKHEDEKAYQLIKKNLLKSLSAFTLGNVAFWSLYYYFAATLYEGRLLQGLHLVFLYLSFLMQIVVSSIAIYFRAQKMEPFAWLSMVSAIVMVLVMLISIQVIQSNYYFMGFLVSNALAMLWAIEIFIKKDRVKTKKLSS